jgi:hypothetical protein
MGSFRGIKSLISQEEGNGAGLFAVGSQRPNAGTIVNATIPEIIEVFSTVEMRRRNEAGIPIQERFRVAIPPIRRLRLGDRLQIMTGERLPGAIFRVSREGELHGIISRGTEEIECSVALDPTGQFAVSVSLIVPVTWISLETSRVSRIEGRESSNFRFLHLLPSCLRRLLVAQSVPQGVSENQ